MLNFSFTVWYTNTIIANSLLGNFIMIFIKFDKLRTLHIFETLITSLYWCSPQPDSTPGPLLSEICGYHIMVHFSYWMLPRTKSHPTRKVPWSCLAMGWVSSKCMHAHYSHTPTKNVLLPVERCFQLSTNGPNFMPVNFTVKLNTIIFNCSAVVIEGQQ